MKLSKQMAGLGKTVDGLDQRLTKANERRRALARIAARSVVARSSPGAGPGQTRERGTPGCIPGMCRAGQNKPEVRYA